MALVVLLPRPHLDKRLVRFLLLYKGFDLLFVPDISNFS